MTLILKPLWMIGIVCALSVAHGSSIKAALEELHAQQTDALDPVNTDLSCNLQQTMAWKECGHIECPSTCLHTDDCTFPYCDSLRKCSCKRAFCVDDATCQFFRIDCPGNFTCNDGNCRCNYLP